MSTSRWPSRFGEPAFFPIVERFVGTGNPLGYITDTAESPPDADGWHTDITWIEDPPKMAFLQAISIPERGGDTMWANLYAAFDALSPPMQALCRRLSVVHTVSPVIVDAFRARAGDDLAEKVMVEFPPVVHPLVRTHPETGRDALFVAGAFMTGIDGMHDDESAAFLGVPEPPYRESQLPHPVELATGRPRHLGRALHEPPRALRPLPAVPADAPLHGERRSAHARLEGCTLNTPDEIRALMYRYCEMIDAGDVDGLVDLFADAVLGGFEGTREWQGREEIRAMYGGAGRRERTPAPGVRSTSPRTC